MSYVTYLSQLKMSSSRLVTSPAVDHELTCHFSPPSGHTIGASTRSSASSPAEDTHFENKAELKNERPPRFTSPYMSQLFIDDPPIDVEGPDSSIHKNYVGCDPCPAQILLSSNEYLPATLEQNKIGIKLALRVVGGNVAKRIVISAKVGCSTIKKLHDTRVEFYFGVDSHIKNLTLQKINSDIVKDGGAGKTYLVSWDTTGGIGIGVGVSRSEFDPETRSSLLQLRVLSGKTEEKPSSVRLVVAASRELKSLLKICIANATEKVPWSPYCDKLMHPLLSFDKMQSRRDVETESGGLLRYPARNAFASVTEASVALAYGIMLEFRQAPLHNMRHAWPGSEHNEAYLQQIMRALGIVFDQSVSDDKMITDRKTWQDLLLNQRPDALPVFSPTRVIDDQGLVLSSMQALLRCYNWTEEQNAALKGCTWLTARVGIVEGHRGVERRSFWQAWQLSTPQSACTSLSAPHLLPLRRPSRDF